MACIELIYYRPNHVCIDNGEAKWIPVDSKLSIKDLPQIFWRDGHPWNEVNLWALEMVRSREVKLKTVKSLMEHLHKYANWLEESVCDWRHFPITKSERVLVRYRGALVDSRDHGELSSSTTSARMRAVIRFYRYCTSHNFISHAAPKWQDKVAIIKYFDPVGFERTMNRVTTSISIPNRQRPGLTLEDGLLPIASQHMLDLLSFTENNVSPELHLMLLIGFFTGARLGTITTLRINSINQSMQDPMTPGMWVIPIGPGTGISTKFDVSGDLLVPKEVMSALKKYAYSSRHLDRVIKAKDENKSFLFLTKQGKPYNISSVDRAMVDLRRTGVKAELKFLQKFRFHQTRATFGTWLITILLKTTSVKPAIEFLKRAMHHKHESTAFRYIKFIEHTKAKIDVSNAFTEAFLGIEFKPKE